MHNLISKLSLMTVCGVLSLSVLLAASNPNDLAREQFRRVMDVLQSSTAASSDALTDALNDSRDPASLRSYVLYPYLQAARWNQRVQKNTLDASADDAIAAWLTQQGNAPVTVELRRAWLLSLAKRSEWSRFLAFYPAETADAELRCAWLNAQLAQQKPLPTEAVTSLFMTAERLSSTCNAPFDWARTNRVITNEQELGRARLALAQGNVVLARDLLQNVPAAQAAPLQQWAALLEAPKATLDALLAKPGRLLDRAALQAGWTRLVRLDVDAGIARLPRVIAAWHLDAATASPLVRDLALSLSWNRRDEALSYFARVLPADMTDQAQEWQARAALWQGNWVRVKQTIERMPEALRTQARWRYWHARAGRALQEPAATAALQALVDNDDNYYAAMAAAQLNVPYVPHPKPLVVDDEALASIGKQPALQRALELVAVQLRDAADREWRGAQTTWSDAEKRAAARYAAERGWYDQAIIALAKQGVFDDYELLYPRPYDAAVDAGTARSGLPSSLIYAVMRQETLFRADARSVADARGLLQLLPATARQIARRSNLPPPSLEALYQPDINVPLGALYLKSLHQQFDGQTELALAAYNAGPNAVRRWLPQGTRGRTLDMDVWIENIPYNETRTYVQRIAWHRLIFDWLRTGKPVLTRAWVAQVQPAA